MHSVTFWGVSGTTATPQRGLSFKNENSVPFAIRESIPFARTACKRPLLPPVGSLFNDRSIQRVGSSERLQTTEENAVVKNYWVQDAVRLSSSGLMWFACDLLMRHEALAQTVSAALAAPELTEELAMPSATQGIISALLLILFSEIGDKTFFVALILSLQNSKSAVFTGTFGALGIMTLISVALGQALHQIDEVLPESVAQFPVDDILAIALLIWFGLITLQGAQDAEATAAAEKEEAEKGVKTLSPGSGGLILSTFVLVFSAEWGDKSFLATTALSAASSPLGVTVGAIAGHLIATILAVLSGSVLSKYISEKTVQYIGGSLFLLFALTTAVDLVRRVT